MLEKVSIAIHPLSGKRKPKVSVIVPIYNAETYLHQCLDSIVLQTLSDIEIICLNDGSTDRSLKIAERFSASDKRIRIINKENSGYGDSMNRGLKAATGEFIGIIESDDYAEPEMFERLYHAAKKNNAEIVKSNFFERLERLGKDSFVRALPPSDIGHIISPTDHTDIFRVQPSIWSAIYRRGFLERNGIDFLPSPGASFQDTSFNLKTLLCANMVLLVPEAYVHYRRDNIYSSNSSEYVFAVCREYDCFETFLERFSEKKQKIIHCLQSVKFETYCWNLLRLDKNLRREFMVKMYTTFEGAREQGLLKKRFFSANAWKLLHLLLNNDTGFVGSLEAEWESRYAR
jgi:glycosyltransferase involved in cell wall biosynthesis